MRLDVRKNDLAGPETTSTESFCSHGSYIIEGQYLSYLGGMHVIKGKENAMTSK